LRRKNVKVHNVYETTNLFAQAKGDSISGNCRSIAWLDRERFHIEAIQ